MFQRCRSRKLIKGATFRTLFCHFVPITQSNPFFSPLRTLALSVRLRVHELCTLETCFQTWCGQCLVHKSTVLIIKGHFSKIWISESPKATSKDFLTCFWPIYSTDEEGHGMEAERYTLIRSSNIQYFLVFQLLGAFIPLKCALEESQI